MSTWLRDYVYIYMGGNRVSTWHYYMNILVVFLLSGLWHGANFTFVLWGLWYGVFICLENFCLKKFLQNKPWLAHIYALLLIIFGWVMFRADTVEYAVHYWGVMIGKCGMKATLCNQYLSNDVVTAIVLGVVFSFDWRRLYVQLVHRFKMFGVARWYGYIVSVALFIISVTSVISSSHNPFIYFRF